MNIWSQVPFFRLLIPFITGILAAIYSGWHPDLIDYLIVFLFTAVTLFVLVKRMSHSYAYSWILGTIVSVLIFLFGFQLTVFNTERYDPLHFSRHLDGAELLYVKINAAAVEKEKTFKVPVEALYAKCDGQWIRVAGKALCYFKKDSLSAKFQYGDMLVIKSKFTAIKPPGNPDEFNYQRLLSFRNIGHQAFIDSGSWIRQDSGKGNPVISASLNLRQALLNIYRENGIAGDEFAVGSALVLGYTDELDQDIISAYAGSGALHVLSVSGLHVGIVFLLFNFLLRFLDRVVFGKVIRVVLLLVVLWFYAALTGLSPAVLRAAAMFSIIVIAQAWKYNTNIFNTVAVSGFALLMANPFMLMEAGFQLSFLAVLGIVSIQPWLYEKWQPDNWWIDQIWQLTAVSIAAQAATFPLGLMYFHQFPNYFLFSNLLVIPLSSIILCWGILVFAVGKIAVVGVLSAKVFSWLVFALNKVVIWTEEAPGSLTQGISITASETIVIYFLLLTAMAYIYNRRFRYFLFSLFIVGFLISIQVVEEHFSRIQGSMVVYSVPKASAYDFISGENSVFLADSSLAHNKGKMQYHVQPNRWERNIALSAEVGGMRPRFFSNDYIGIRNGFVQFRDKRIAIIDSAPGKSKSLMQKFRTDIIVLSKNARVRISDLKKYFEFGLIIIDSSNSEWKNKAWKAECERLKVNCYSVIDSGAYVEEL